jgi:flagellar biosynthetic protein FliQ
MEQAYALSIAKQGMDLALMIVLPLLGVSLSVGLGVSIFQSVTSVQESTLTFVPKMVAIAGTLTVMGSWMLTQIISYVHLCFEHIKLVGKY